MQQGIEPTLYTDPQAQTITFWCPRCRGALYPPGFYCLRCEEDRP